MHKREHSQREKYIWKETINNQINTYFQYQYIDMYMYMMYTRIRF